MTGKEDEKDIKEMKDFDDFDDAFPKGIYAFPSPKCLPSYNIRRISEYMKENGIQGEITDDELQQFIIEPKSVICRAVKTVEEATHWLATIDDALGECEVTPFQLYQIFYDRYHNECLIMNDNKEFSLIYMWHEGRFVVLE